MEFNCDGNIIRNTAVVGTSPVTYKHDIFPTAVTKDSP